MPFDPTLPVNNSPISSAELRNQFTALNDLIYDFAAQANDNLNNTANSIYSTITTQIASDAANNVDSFDVPNLTISDPPTQAEVQQLADIVRDLVIALRHG